MSRTDRHGDRRARLDAGGAGAETVTKLLGNAAVTFAHHPDQWQKLREDKSKVPAAFEELLRYEAPTQYQLRYSTLEVTLHETTIPAGSVVMLINGSATRDERAFPDPDRFDIDRIPSGHNLNFGYGAHSCLGAALARMEGRIALEVMLDLMPEYQLDPAGLRRVTMANVAGWSNVPTTVIRDVWRRRMAMCPNAVLHQSGGGRVEVGVGRVQRRGIGEVE